MADEPITTLDYIDKITVKGNPFAEPANEYYALICLRSGLGLLNHQAKRCEQIAKKQLDPTKRTVIYGGLPGMPMPLLTCFFHWHSISACQYVRTIGAIAYRQDNSRLTSLKYIESIIPEVKTYRDKIAAHFAWLTKSKHDNDAERLASIIPQVTWCEDSFQVQVFKISQTSGGKSSSSKALQPWSITKIHKRLQERYWPEELETK